MKINTLMQINIPIVKSNINQLRMFWSELYLYKWKIYLCLWKVDSHSLSQSNIYLHN